MKLKTVYNIADGIAPFSLSEAYCKAYSHHDNSGVLAGRFEDEIEAVLFSLDLSEKAVNAAKSCGANCIITHHPAIFYPISALNDAQNGSLLFCLREKISLIAAHLNLDAAKGGIDECLMRGLGGKDALFVMDVLPDGGYGRIFETERMDRKTFSARAKETFQSDKILFYGDKPVKRVASFCGAGFDERALAFAKEGGADTLVSSDAKHHLLAAALEQGMNVMLIPHYAAEFYGFEAFYGKMKEQTGLPCTLFCDKDLL